MNNNEIMDDSAINDLLITVALDSVLKEVTTNPKLTGAKNNIKSILIRMRQANVTCSLTNLATRIRSVLGRYDAFDKPSILPDPNDPVFKTIPLGKKQLGMLQLKMEIAEIVHKPERRDAKLEMIDVLQQIKIEETEVTIDDLINMVQKIKTEHPLSKPNSITSFGKTA